MGAVGEALHRVRLVAAAGVFVDVDAAAVISSHDELLLVDDGFVRSVGMVDITTVLARLPDASRRPPKHARVSLPRLILELTCTRINLLPIISVIQ